MAAIPEFIVRDSVELTRVLSTADGQLFLRAMEHEVMSRIEKILSPQTPDDEAIRQRHVVIAICGMVDRELLTPLRMAQGWMAKRQAKDLVR